MLHAFPGAPTESFHLSAEVEPREVRLVIEDTGIGLPPGRAEQDVVDLTATSGRGLHMIRELMTDVAVEPGPHHRGTRLRDAPRLLARAGEQLAHSLSGQRPRRAALAPGAPCTPPPGWADAEPR